MSDIPAPTKWIKDSRIARKLYKNNIIGESEGYIRVEYERLAGAYDDYEISKYHYQCNKEHYPHLEFTLCKMNTDLYNKLVAESFHGNPEVCLLLDGTRVVIDDRISYEMIIGDYEPKKIKIPDTLKTYKLQGLKPEVTYFDEYTLSEEQNKPYKSFYSKMKGWIRNKLKRLLRGREGPKTV